MKFLLFTLLTLSTAYTNLYAQKTDAVTGAWRTNEGNNTHHLFFQDGFYFHTVQEGSQFLRTAGGTYALQDKSIICKILFDSSDSSKVGTQLSIPFSVNASNLNLDISERQVTLERADNGTTPLAGVWRITGRMQEDGKIAQIHQTGTRQTYKMLTGSKFQWVAIDPGTKQFSGTGGGNYTFKDGKYIENIEFFSRDNSRVGASLSFDGKLENGDWHHSGLSSKGAKIYEIWSRVNK